MLIHTFSKKFITTQLLQLNMNKTFVTSLTKKIQLMIELIKLLHWVCLLDFGHLCLEHHGLSNHLDVLSSLEHTHIHISHMPNNLLWIKCKETWIHLLNNIHHIMELRQIKNTCDHLLVNIKFYLFKLI